MVNSGVLALTEPYGRYVRPQLVGERPAPPKVNEWVVIGIALALAIIYYGSLTGFCLAVCGGWGHVASCQAQWGVWAQATCK